MTNEEFYDAEIAPALLELGEKCKERGMALVAGVEYARAEDWGSTVVGLFEQEGLACMLWAAYALRCGNNLDSFMGAIIRMAKERGHSSIYMMQLGVPMEPTA